MRYPSALTPTGRSFFLLVFFCGSLLAPHPAPLAAGELADRLAGVKFDCFALAPGYSEGPTWRDGELFFCSGALLRRTVDGRVGRYLGISPAGTILTADKSLLICDNRHKAILQLTPDGKLLVLADQYEGEKLRGLNDLTLDARGNVYWSDPEGSSLAKPVGHLYRLTPQGVVSRIAGGLAFPNGLEVDPASEHLYVIESQSKKILRYALPADDAPCGEATMFYDLGGSGGDGCAFDARGNLWVADFHRPETKQGRIIVLSPGGERLAALDVPAQVVSNIAFGGANHDEIFCTTGTPAGVFHASVGVAGFRGHPGRPIRPLRELVIDPADEASPVSPRRFGVPGGIGLTRGFYLWKRFNPETWEAEVAHDRPSGETYQVRVLPWATTYRRLSYGARPDALRPGERVNLFFNPDERHSRGYVVHFQDELCQMKGHGQAWRIHAVEPDGKSFTAQAVGQDKPLEESSRRFTLAPKCEIWHAGKVADQPHLTPGERRYLSWSAEGERRVVYLLADDASADAIQEAEQARIAAEVAQEGLAGFIESVQEQTSAPARVAFLVFSTYWRQAGQLKPGQTVQLTRTNPAGFRPQGATVAARVVSQKNHGTYGSGVNDVVLELVDPASAAELKKWPVREVARLIPHGP